MSFKIALIGDMHSFWSPFDTEFFNTSDYEYLFFTGDLPRIVGGVADARKLAEVNKPGIVVPGNHDGATIPQFLAELKNYPQLCRVTSLGQTSRVKQIAKALGDLEMGGFSIHPLNQLGDEYACIVARPHSMGGDRFYFQAFIERQFGVATLQDSQALLFRLIDKAPDNLIFLAHNGPSGLGSKPTDPWGCDFNPRLGDFGDPDLRAAIDYAKQQGKQVLAVVAGHMHHHLKGADHAHEKGRTWCVRDNGVLYINAARVPRIFRRNGRVWHHHIALSIADSASCEEVLVSPDGEKMVTAP